MAHRIYKNDIRDANSTRTMVHKNSKECNVWELQKYQDDVYRIILSKNQVNAGGNYNQENWVLNS